jgi:hypothetical protein
VNVYVVAEGEVTEKLVYKSWIPLVNPSLSFVDRADLLRDNHFTIYGGRGYPFYFQMIDDAIDDINALGNIQRLVIAIDSEDMTYEEKRTETLNHVSDRRCSAEIRVIVQHFCIECWALGNRRICCSNPQDQRLRDYKKHYNVRIKDPELMPPYPGERLNRAQFATRYLNLLLQHKFQRKGYSKNRPDALLHPKYFEQLKKRFVETGHIRSFNDFLSAFE